MNFTVVYGSLVSSYTGTTRCTNLDVYGIYETIEEAKDAVEKCFETTSDLVIVIDLKTGKKVLKGIV